MMESNGLWHGLQGNYHLPCLKLPGEEQAHSGIWVNGIGGISRKPVVCLTQSLLTGGKPNGYYAGIDRQAREMFEQHAEQMTKHEGVGVTKPLNVTRSMEAGGK